MESLGLAAIAGIALLIVRGRRGKDVDR